LIAGRGELIAARPVPDAPRAHVVSIRECFGSKAGCIEMDAENGELPMSEAWAKRLAPHMGVRPDELWDGPQIPVVGYVGAGARVHAFDDLLNLGETIDRPPMTAGDLFAVEVKGESMLPLAEEGWHIVYTAAATVDESAVLTKVCVVALEDEDTMLVKRVMPGSKPQHYHLLSINAEPLVDVRLRWAAVVKAIVPR
jgi:SOS-response transcriptional repressor LexA